MNQQIKQQWVEALRSGTYVQCLGELRNGSDEYCVNGVLCELHNQAEAGGRGWHQLGVRRSWCYLQGHTFPARAVREWAGLDDETCLDLEAMNDARGSEGLSFIELAAYIDNNL